MLPGFGFSLPAHRQSARGEASLGVTLLLALLLASLTARTGGMAGPAHATPLRPAKSLPLIDSNPITQVQADPAPNCLAPPGTLVPLQVAHAYGYDQLWGQNVHGENMTVYLVELGPVLQSDPPNYFSCIGYDGATHFTTVTVDTPPVVSSASYPAMAEATLDTEMVAGLARSINIVDVQTDGNAPGDVWQHVDDELRQILALVSTATPGQSLVSISLGEAEVAIPEADRLAIDQSLASLVRDGVSIFAASGDSGGQGQVSFPACDPWVTAVGGTELTVDAQGNRTLEVGWPGSGGGASQFFARPSYEQAPGMDPAIQARQVPDVSAAAANLPLYFNGEWTAASGTSASAPIWAAGAALLIEALKQQGSAPPSFPRALYAAAASGNAPFFDVTRGNNGFATAPGWDYVSGLGTPNLPALLQALQSSAALSQGTATMSG
jgi:kumamolisin